MEWGQGGPGAPGEPRRPLTTPDPVTVPGKPHGPLTTPDPGTVPGKPHGPLTIPDPVTVPGKPHGPLTTPDPGTAPVACPGQIYLYTQEGEGNGMVFKQNVSLTEQTTRPISHACSLLAWKMIKISKEISRV